MIVKEGYMPFLEYQTYYRIVGEPSDKTPLLLLHGGPGSTHNYFELLDDLSLDNRQVIMYDQLGCGLSSMPDNPELWIADTWLEELIALREYLKLDKIHILGQSWGGMLLIKYMCDKSPEGVESIILSSTLSSAKLWKEEQHRLINMMSLADQKAIEKAEKTNDFSHPDYLKANETFMLRHAGDAPSENSPEPLRRPKKRGEQAYLHAWGPNEFFPMGTLSTFDYTSELKHILTPTLIISGADDLSTPLIAKTMYDEIPHARWELFQHSRHLSLVDEEIKYKTLLIDWLNQYDK
ncbi:proline iminopeptidase [Vagococcus luciliae]|uniref:Proline iminopeptidase n=1 Tax=Vagococcus luciliae TaxID=2920380 RepID=A0ABY5NXW1_9ENTE|nr:proline iminopeptidase-family hydrolase [Vagococcus luciliae]UUV98491.1 Proline iminopeptidase [Vagococcus luciliae]